LINIHTEPNFVSQLATPAKKTGKACAFSVLGIVTLGDSGVDAAKRDGGIKTVSTVDQDMVSILGVYGQYCSVVKGE
jgi:hypothetical protein